MCRQGLRNFLVSGRGRAPSLRVQIRLATRSGSLFLASARGRAREHAQYFFFAHDDEVFAIDLDFGAGILAEQNAVAFFYIEGTNLAFFADLAFAGGDDFSLHRFVFGGVGDDDSATSGVGFFYPTDQDAVMQRGEFGSHSCVTPFKSGDLDRLDRNFRISLESRPVST